MSEFGVPTFGDLSDIGVKFDTNTGKTAANPTATPNENSADPSKSELKKRARIPGHESKLGSKPEFETDSEPAEPPITLLRRGQVNVSKFSKSEQKIINNQTAIDYLIGFIEKRTPKARNAHPIKRPTGPGDKVIVIKAGTASGKSTVIPPHLYKHFFKYQHKNIMVTQPKVINAIDISLGLPQYNKFLEFGKNLGYQTGPFSSKNKDPGILFINIDTFYVIFRNLTPEKIMNRYSFIILDEVHVRKTALDATLLLLKDFLADYWEDPRCPLVLLMSATFDHEKYIKYFKVPKTNFVQISGMSHPIEAKFPKYTPTNLIQYAIETCVKIHEENSNELGEKVIDIITFVNGGKDARSIIEGVHLRNARVYHSNVSAPNKSKKSGPDKSKNTGSNEPEITKKATYIVPIALSSKSFNKGGLEYQDLYSDVKNIKCPIFKLDGDKIDVNGKPIATVTPSRRNIISTNVAETGVTIETLKYCIDTGVVIENEFNPNDGAHMLLFRNITKGAAMQRRGRVGRKAPGVWYPCYTEKTFNLFNEDSFSEIVTSDITLNILHILINQTEAEFRNLINKNDTGRLLFKKHSMASVPTTKLFIGKKANLKNIHYMDSPSSASYSYSTNKLIKLGFIDTHLRPTELGILGASFRKLPIESIRMILAGYSEEMCVMDLITIAAMLEVTRSELIGRKYKMREVGFSKLTSDELVDLLFLWEEFSMVVEKSKDKSNYLKHITDWCIDNKVYYYGFLKVIKIRDEIMDFMLNMGINPYYLKRTEYLISEIKKNYAPVLEQVRKIKRCIYEGFRLNMARWDESRRTYTMFETNQPIFVQSPLVRYMRPNEHLETKITPKSAPKTEAEAKKGGYATPAITSIPKYIIVSTPLIMLNRIAKKYELINSGYISVLDGFVNIDFDDF
jgi:HrpA-like RNA helicase